MQNNILMTDLTKKKCVPCEGGLIPFDVSEIHKYQKKVDGWDVIKNENNIGASPRYIIWLGICRN